MAMVVVGQMLPEGAVKGGTAMALCYGRAAARFTQDLDAARVHPLTDFLDDFEMALSRGWAGFTGRVVDRKPPRPPGIPAAYVMQPFDVKLDYLGRSWRTVKFELGHNEIDDAFEPELRIAADLVELFTDLGLPAPGPIPVMRHDHQVAQKLHAVSEPGSDRVRDLVDLSNFSISEKTSTSANSRRRVCGSSTTGASTRGRRASTSESAGTTSTRLPSRALTYCPKSALRSRGPTASSGGSPMPDGRVTVAGVDPAEEEFLRPAMALPPRERWNLGMRLLESLEVNDADSLHEVDEPRPGEPE